MTPAWAKEAKITHWVKNLIVIHLLILTTKSCLDHDKSNDHQRHPNDLLYT